MRPQVLLCVLFAIAGVSCGGDSQDVEIRRKNPYGNTGKKPGGGGGWGDIKALVDEHCNRCHGVSYGSTLTGDNYGDKAKARVKNGSMPPDKELDEETKRRLSE